jgi:hypothetical protein
MMTKVSSLVLSGCVVELKEDVHHGSAEHALGSVARNVGVGSLEGEDKDGEQVDWVDGGVIQA